MVNNAEILDARRRDKMSVYRMIGIKDDSGITKQEISLVYENLRCKLSVDSIPIPNSDGKVVSQSNSYTVFCKPEYNIFPGDHIKLNTEENRIFKLIAGRSKVYNMGQQISCIEELKQ